MKCVWWRASSVGHPVVLPVQLPLATACWPALKPSRSPGRRRRTARRPGGVTHVPAGAVTQGSAGAKKQQRHACSQPASRPALACAAAAPTLTQLPGRSRVPIINTLLFSHSPAQGASKATKRPAGWGQRHARHYSKLKTARRSRRSRPRPASQAPPLTVCGPLLAVFVRVLAPQQVADLLGVLRHGHRRLAAHGVVAYLRAAAKRGRGPGAGEGSERGIGGKQSTPALLAHTEVHSRARALQARAAPPPPPRLLPRSRGSTWAPTTSRP